MERTSSKMNEPIAANNKVWARFVQNKLGLTGLFIIGMFAAISVLGYLITPDSSPDGNLMCLPLGLKRPGFTTTIIKVQKPAGGKQQGWLDALVFGKEATYKPIPVTSYRINADVIEYKEYLGEDIDGLSATISL